MSSHYDDMEWCRIDGGLRYNLYVPAPGKLSGTHRNAARCVYVSDDRYSVQVDERTKHEYLTTSTPRWGEPIYFATEEEAKRYAETCARISS